MGTTFTPLGRPGSISRIFAFTRSITSRAFCPWRMMTMPETTSPLPSRSDAPRRRSGPTATVPMSLTRMGVPVSLAETTISSKSLIERA